MVSFLRREVVEDTGFSNKGNLTGQMLSISPAFIACFNRLFIKSGGQTAIETRIMP
jgi:hypothetical protein